jgi:DNA-binding NtrC family response regulator
MTCSAALKMEPISSLNILVVDDWPEICDMIHLALSGAGHWVECAGNGRDAVRLLRSSRTFDVLVTDILMPDGDGLELIPQALGANPATRIVAMSGGGLYLRSEYCLLAATRLGAHATLQKPFAHWEVIDAVNRARPRSNSEESHPVPTR